MHWGGAVKQELSHICSKFDPGFYIYKDHLINFVHLKLNGITAFHVAGNPKWWTTALNRKSPKKKETVEVIKWADEVPPGFVIFFSQVQVHWWASWWSLHSWSLLWTSVNCTACESACHLWTRTGGTSNTSDTWNIESTNRKCDNKLNEQPPLFKNSLNMSFWWLLLS